MGYDVELLDELLNRIGNSIGALEKQTRRYDKDIVSTPPEAHLIEAIHNHPEANTSDLAAILGLTKGSISIRTAKLSKKGYIEKYNQKGNKKEVYYRLTPLGKKLYDAHERFHEEQNRKIYKMFASFPESKRKFICDFLKDYADYLENSYLKNK
jgi:DNA-binding MarR family transcriptional regulator